MTQNGFTELFKLYFWAKVDIYKIQAALKGLQQQVPKGLKSALPSFPDTMSDT